MYSIFDNDIAYKALNDLKNSKNIISDIEKYFDKVINSKHIELDECYYTLVSAAIIDSVVNNTQYRCDEDFLEWVKTLKKLNFSSLIQKATKAIDSVVLSNSKLKEIWSSNKWQVANIAMKERLANNLNILEQCQKLNEESEFEKIITILEILEKNIPEIDSELARAYANLGANNNDKKSLYKAIELLKPHKVYFADDYFYNYRMGFANYYLNEILNALNYFNKALEIKPNDEDSKNYIESCLTMLSLPKFEKTFSKRVENAWNEFLKNEAKLRNLIDTSKVAENSEELVEFCGDILHIAFKDISFELGFNDEKYELILIPEGDLINLFELDYFAKNTPNEIFKHWNIVLGRQAHKNMGIVISDLRVDGNDVKVWLDIDENETWYDDVDGRYIGLSIYCEKLLPLCKDDYNRAYWMLAALVDQNLGELFCMKYIQAFDILDTPKDENFILLTNLPEKLQELDFKLDVNAQNLLENYFGYKGEAIKDSDEFRLDIMSGVTCCHPIVNAYLKNDEYYINKLYENGSVAGFLAYPLCDFQGDDIVKEIFNFRDSLEEYLLNNCENSITLIGGATGENYGYVDFIAWDIDDVLKNAKEFFNNTDIRWACFNVFRKEAFYVPLKNEDTKQVEQSITFNPNNIEEFYENLYKLNDKNQFSLCIKTLQEVPEEFHNYRYYYELVRALENYAIIGDNGFQPSYDKYKKALYEAIDILESIRKEGEIKANWNMRMAYAYQYLNQGEKAIMYAKTWSELDPEDEDAKLVINECKEAIEKKRKTK